MAQKQKLTLVNLLDQLAFVKDKAKSQGLSITQIKGLRFIRKDAFGVVTYVDDFKCNLAKNGSEIVIIMLSE